MVATDRYQNNIVSTIWLFVSVIRFTSILIIKEQVSSSGASTISALRGAKNVMVEHYVNMVERRTPVKIVVVLRRVNIPLIVRNVQNVMEVVFVNMVNPVHDVINVVEEACATMEFYVLHVGSVVEGLFVITTNVVLFVQSVMGEVHVYTTESNIFARNVTVHKFVTITRHGHNVMFVKVKIFVYMARTRVVVLNVVVARLAKLILKRIVGWLEIPSMTSTAYDAFWISFLLQMCQRIIEARNYVW